MANKECLMKCIYCLEDKPEYYFTKAEHVMPQSFGMFENNLTLNKNVCDECNQYFGNNLEIDLGRDTIEGLSRYKFGVKAAQDFKTLGKRSRFNFVIAEGLLKGAHAYLEHSEELDEVACKPLPQIGFINRQTGEYKYFRLDELPKKLELEKEGLDYSDDVRVFGVSNDEAQNALLGIGISLSLVSDLDFGDKESDSWLVEIEGSIDKTIYRAIAKIAFNYMAYWHGPEFALQKTFNPIRHYIRRGERAKVKYVLVRSDNILVDEKPDKRRLCHIVTLNWAKNGTSIVSQISLFNNFPSYTVLLSKHYRGKTVNLRKGHFFNFGDNRIHELTAK